MKTIELYQKYAFLTSTEEEVVCLGCIFWPVFVFSLKKHFDVVVQRTSW